MAGLAMTREDIIRMARKAGDSLDKEWLVRFAAIIAAAEREACAKVCDKWYEVACSYESERRTHHYIMGKGARECAHAIRTRDDR